MEKLFQNVESIDLIFCVGRALVLGILVSSEAALAQRRRVGFERPLILFTAAALLLIAEIFGAALSLFKTLLPAYSFPRFWVWYPTLSIVGLLGIAFCFDFVRASANSDETVVAKTIRRHGRRFVIQAGVVLAIGALILQRPLSQPNPPTSFDHLGGAAYILHGLQAAAFLMLGWKVFQSHGLWLSVTEARIFLIGCASGFIGALLQIQSGPREFLTMIAYTFFVAVFLRENFRRSESEAVHASEQRTARTLLFHRITTQLKSTYDLPRLYEITMDSLRGHLAAESGAIYIAPKGIPELLPVLVHGKYPAPIFLPEAADSRGDLKSAVESTPIPFGVGILGKVAATGVPVYIYDRAEAKARYTWPTGEVEVRSTMALPLRSPEGVNGVIQLVNRMDGQPFSEEDLRFMSLIVEQAGLAIYNARLHNDMLQQQRNEEQIKIARDIQLRLLPSDLPNIPGLSIGAEYRAAQEVSGDYFDFYRIDHDHLGIIVLDVAGKGVPGALLMAVTATLLKMATARSNSPAWVLNEVNAALSQEMRKGLYVTGSYAVLRLSTLQLTHVSAGHPALLVIRDKDGVCEKHKPKGAAIGLLRPNRFRAVLEQETIQLDVGDALVMYTDGVIEAMDAGGNQFGETELCRVAKEKLSYGGKVMAAEIVKAVERHAGSTPQYDDITLVALRVAPDGDEAIEGPG